MKVLIIASTDDRLGGAKSLLELVELLKQKGVQVIVVNPFHNNLNIKLNEMNIENYSVGYHLNICRIDCGPLKFVLKYCVKFIRYKLYQIRGIYNLKKKIDFTQIDVIHQNNSVEDVGVYFSKKYNIPLVWHLREFGDKDFDFYYFHRNIGKYISDNSQRVIAISNAVRDAWVEKGISTEKIVTIVHGVNPDGIITRKEHEEKIRIVFAGNIVPQKGQFDFIKAINQLDAKNKQSILVDFYGTCAEDYRKEIITYIDDNGLQKTIRLMGYSNNLKSHLCEYDVGVVNSRCEAMGRVTIEYMMAGLCVLASNTGANPEMLSDNCGVLYEYNNSVSMLDALSYLLSNTEKIKLYGEHAREKALTKYSITKNVSLFVELYENALMLHKKELSR